jgi:hypothetical protein
MNMDTQEMITTILKTSYTKNDIGRRLRLLREYMEKCFFTPIQEDMTKFLISQQATTDDIDTFIRWGDEFFKAFSKNTLYKFIIAMSEHMKAMPIVTLYIPYEPVPAEVIKIGKWFRMNVNEGVLMDLHTDPSLLGGCAFVWHGIYRDYSLRYYMLKKREAIERIIEEYVAKFYAE